MKQALGILTGGGDCPGLNAVIRAAVRRAALDGVPMMGIRRGWDGLRDGDFMPLTRTNVAGILPRGGTILGTSRTNPLSDPDSLIRIRKNFAEAELGGLIVVGGNGTLAAAREMFHRHKMPVVGVPKTIDNDLQGTDVTFGFDTAVSVATDAIDRLHTTAESHDRVMILEVMGRMVGWIAATAGIAGGADIVLVPEKPFKISEIIDLIESRRKKKLTFSIIVVAEAARPDESEDFLSEETKEMLYNERNLGGIGRQLAREIEKRTQIETRVTVLGYTQRGGSPTAFDRVLATRYGMGAVELALDEKWGQMVAIQGQKMTSVSLDVATQAPKVLDPDLYRTAEMFFG